MKKVDMNRPVADLVAEHPEIVVAMQKAGFAEIGNPIMLRTVGKVMTLSKGARMRGIPWERVVAVLTEYGFKVSE